MASKGFDLGAWAKTVTGGTPPRGTASAVPLPPGPTAEDVVRGMVDWMRASHDYGRPDNPPAWVADEATWERAKKAVEKNWGNYAEPYAVVTHVYENMGGGFK